MPDVDCLGVIHVLLDDWRANPVSLVVEATGSAEGFERAIAALRPRGTVVLKSTISERPDLDLSPLVIDAIHVVGSRCGPFPPALRALELGSIDVRSLISEKRPDNVGHYNYPTLEEIRIALGSAIEIKTP